MSYTHSVQGHGVVEEEIHVRLPGVSVFGERFLVLMTGIQILVWSIMAYDFPFDLDDDGMRLRDYVIQLRYVRTIPLPR